MWESIISLFNCIYLICNLKNLYNNYISTKFSLRKNNINFSEESYMHIYSEILTFVSSFYCLAISYLREFMHTVLAPRVSPRKIIALCYLRATSKRASFSNKLRRILMAERSFSSQNDHHRILILSSGLWNSVLKSSFFLLHIF